MRYGRVLYQEEGTRGKSVHGDQADLGKKQRGKIKTFLKQPRKEGTKCAGRTFWLPEHKQLRGGTRGDAGNDQRETQKGFDRGGEEST